VGLLLAAGSGNSVTVTPGAGSLTLTGFAPTVTAQQNATASPIAGALVLTGLAPTVSATQNQATSPGTGALVITGHAPTVSNGTPDVTVIDADGMYWEPKRKPRAQHTESVLADIREAIRAATAPAQTEEEQPEPAPEIVQQPVLVVEPLAARERRIVADKIAAIHSELQRREINRLIRQTEAALIAYAEEIEDEEETILLLVA
jgi:hypothetical protein